MSWLEKLQRKKGFHGLREFSGNLGDFLEGDSFGLVCLLDCYGFFLRPL
jgi:hypothetical protein